MIINEILNTEVENYQVTAGETYFYTSCDIEDKRYDFTALKYVSRTPDYWLVSFEYKEKDTTGQTYRYGPGDIGRTGTGDEFKVFSFVKKSMIDFFSKYNPSIVIFSAGDQYRTRLYQRLLDRYKPKNYNLELMKSEQNNSTFFILKKTNAVR